MIRVLLADDQPLVRAGFRVFIDAAPDMEVAGEAADGAEAIRLATELVPDVVLMDIRMPELDGIAATRAITADPRLADTRVLVLTTFEVDEYVFEALRAGASGFLGKGIEPEELVSALRVVAHGDALLSPLATRQLIADYIARPRQTSTPALGTLDGLTNRETEVVRLVAEGLTNDEIAERLFLSPATAKTHVNRAMTKLGARDRAQLVVMAYQARLIDPTS
ncbi:DNA-binding response regulator, NarL/FixJ family, contains REC and HTH domains [Parafrankia irregularis]|uniref:DNA-binding response regulator, NarL/FixJ family, contains REC and HTH domains n=1 Tax=Parafrankia irregularis TaxID=795642 RepID=A0A0S4QSK0_9ACTN|nr:MULTISPECIES: response regulator transcription factor [Parafrankia]MBE3205956.1 response regulator transcription factor [Parafrankia sp. CH37]CUU58095.1 DNA-binding response regulator, NarL/FixJ family, contains REC and HTH domains [Parafrankia irregularis]